MAEHLYGEEWDSDEFQTALKVVLKCEIQSLLERLSETGEETVLLTASATDLCVGHLASSKALRFVNTADVGVVKNKFLNFVTGAPVPQPQVTRQGSSVPATSTNKGKVSQISNVICNSITPKSSVVPSDTFTNTANVKPVTQNQPRPSEKRPLESSTDSNSQSIDPKKRKTDTQVPVVKGTSVTSFQTIHASPSSASLSQASTNKGPLTKLKTTKVVSKSGGFTEERFSDAEFQKFLAQYKPNLPASEVDEDTDSKDATTMPRIVTQAQGVQQKPFLPSPVSCVQNTQNKSTAAVNSSIDRNVKNVNQSGKNQSFQKQNIEPKKDLISAKLDNKIVNKENRENVNTMVTEIKEEIDPDDLEFKDSQNSGKKDSEQNITTEKDKARPLSGITQKKEVTGQPDKSGVSAQSRNRLESIDNMDTEMLIQMTKAKHLESMSEAEREVQAKLGQLSSKLSWVVEYPKEKGRGEPAAQSTSSTKPQASLVSSTNLIAGAVHPGVYHGDPDEEDIDEMDEEDFMDDDEFDENDLDEEDKAALKAMREAKMRKLEEFGEGGMMYPQGYAVSQQFNAEHYSEDYEEEGEYDDYEEIQTDGTPVNVGHLKDNRIHGAMPTLAGPNYGRGHSDTSVGPVSQPYQRTASPTSENFLMIGPIMAKCLLCNRLIRKTEMKTHHETHLKQRDEEEEDIEGLEDEEQHQGDYGTEEGDYPPDEGYGVEEGEYPGQVGEYAEEEGDYPGEEGEYPGEEGEYPGEEGEYPGEEGEYPGEEGEYPGEEGEYPEDYEFQEEEGEEGIEFTAEKFVAEKLVAEKIDMSESSQEGKENECDICHKSFKSHANMMRHRKNIHKDQLEKSGESSMNSPCPVCGKSFRYVQKHLKNKHPEYRDSMSAEACETPGDGLKCSICGEQFTEEEKLKEHFKVHA